MSTLFANQEALWLGALAAAPVALLVAALCRGIERPGTRHVMWCLALLAFVVPGVLLATGWASKIDDAVREVPRAIASAFPPERAEWAGAVGREAPRGRAAADASQSAMGPAPSPPTVASAPERSRTVPAAGETRLGVEESTDHLSAGAHNATFSSAPDRIEGIEPTGGALVDADWPLGARADHRDPELTRQVLDIGPSRTSTPAGPGFDTSPGPVAAREEQHERIQSRAGLPASLPAPSVRLAEPRLTPPPHAGEGERVGIELPRGGVKPEFLSPQQGVALRELLAARKPGDSVAGSAGPTPVQSLPEPIVASAAIPPLIVGQSRFDGSNPIVASDRDDEAQTETAKPAIAAANPGVGSDAGGSRPRATSPVIQDPVWNALRSASDGLSVWSAAIGSAAASILEIPAPPAALWASGIALILIVGSARAMAGRASVRRVVPVDRSDRRLVEDLSERLGLRRAPRAYLVRSRISPMVCGWLNPRIVLPEGLWRSLDLDGRRAVLTHELAHLHRRDQWVRLIELVIGVVYWWHPVLWAVRKRIREEADLCCDAWVTTLFPRLRRSYAEALLRTRVYLSIPGAVAPVAGLGMASARSRRFSRRLTMVMTGQNRAKASPLGVALAVAVGTVTLVVAPSLAHTSMKKGDRCPPETAATVVSGHAGTVHTAHEAHTTAAHEAHAGHAGVGLTSAFGSSAGSQTFGSAAAPRVASTTAAASPDSASCCGTGAATVAASGPVSVGSLTSTGASTLGGNYAAFVPYSDARVASGAVVYRGSNATSADPVSAGSIEDRLASLEARMERLDASIQRLLQRMEGSGNAAGRAIAPTNVSRAPLSMPQVELMHVDDGEVAWRSYRLDGGKLDALWELMARDDVPIYVRSEGNGIALQGTPAQQEVFARFLALINPDGAEGYAAAFLSEDAWLADPFFAQGTTATNVARVAEVEAAARRNALAARERAMADHQRAMEAELVARMGQQREVMAEHRRQMERQIQSQVSQAEAVERRAVETENRAAEIEARMGSARNDQQRERLQVQAEALRAQADALREQADALREQADAMREAFDEARAEMDEAIADMEGEEADARAELEEALAELRAELAEARAEFLAETGEHAENCACSDDCAGEACEDDCDDDCHCRTGAAVAAPAAPARPARAAAPARAARPAQPARPASTPRPQRD